jgi:DNA-binding transcriptional LysR family regulator
MELRHLQTFLQVASLQNFTQAAKMLGYSQSNVSAQIQQLEQEIGVLLFKRIGRHVLLTQYGEELVPYAQQVITDSLRMQDVLKDKTSLGGTIRIGMVQSLFDNLFQDALTKYHVIFPKVKIALTIDGTEILKNQAKHGLLDAVCVIDNPLSQREWTCLQIQPVKIVVIANPGNKLTRKKALTLAELEAENLILMEDTASYAQHFQHLLAGQSLKLEPFLKMQSTHMALQLVEAGNYITVLPEYVVSQAAQDQKVTILKLPEFQQLQYVQFALHKSSIRTIQNEAFLQILYQSLQKHILHKD